MPLSCLLSCLAAGLPLPCSRLHRPPRSPTAGRAFAAPLPPCGPSRPGRTAAGAGTRAARGEVESRCPLLDRHPRPAWTQERITASPRLGRDIPPGRRERSGRCSTPPARSSQRRYGDRAVVVPRDAVTGQDDPAALRHPNPPDLAPVGPHDSAIIARSEGRRPQALIIRSCLEHPVGHPCRRGQPRCGRDGEGRPAKDAHRGPESAGPIRRIRPSFATVIFHRATSPSAGRTLAVPGVSRPPPAPARATRCSASPKHVTSRTPENY
jgi:hypothetical protein